MKSIIARLNPITNTPVVFIADSKKDGQIDAFVEGQIKRVGIDYYQNSLKLARADAIEVARLFAEHEKLPFDELIVRERLPKTFPNGQQPKKNASGTRKRATNDANLKLVETDKKDGKQALARAAQDLHDKETKPQEQENKRRADDKRSTPENPEGAVVQRTKRPYNKKGDKELSKRSAAALKRYQQELAKTASQSPTMMEGVAHQLPQGEFEKKVADLTAEIVKILLKNPGVL